MKNIILLFIVVLLIPITIISFRKKTNFIMEEKIYINYEKEKLELDDYVFHVVASEMPALFEEEALKAQILATRTFTYNKIKNNNDYIFTTSDQMYKSDEELEEIWQEKYNEYKDKIIKLIEETKGEIITYDDEPIESYYFSMSNGYTENAKEVFNEDKEYLQSVESPYESNLNNYTVTKELSLEEFKNILSVDNPIIINSIQKDNSNRVISIVISNKYFKGTDIRKLLDLRSTDFDIEVKDKVYITTKGYGHGVGMSQYGANELAKRGFKYKEILSYYYQNTKIQKI